MEEFERSAREIADDVLSDIRECSLTAFVGEKVDGAASATVEIVKAMEMITGKIDSSESAIIDQAALAIHAASLALPVPEIVAAEESIRSLARTLQEYETAAGAPYKMDLKPISKMLSEAAKWLHHAIMPLTVWSGIHGMSDGEPPTNRDAHAILQANRDSHATLEGDIADLSRMMSEIAARGIQHTERMESMRAKVSATGRRAEAARMFAELRTNRRKAETCVAEIAMQLRVSERNVWRYLKQAGLTGKTTRTKVTDNL